MYEGPGIYKHYKGGTYTVIGLGEDESSRRKYVVYFSHTVQHGHDEMFWLRPLNVQDKDLNDPEARAFNEPVRVGSESQTARFTRTVEFRNSHGSVQT